MIKVGMVSSIRPETNYTAYLAEALQRSALGVNGQGSGSLRSQVEVYVYCEKDERNREVPLQNLRLCWERNWRYFYQILFQAKRDKLNLLHFQHEFNMFGGPRTALLFPFLVGLSRLLGFNVIVTVHAVVARRLMNQEFLKIFGWPRLLGLTPLIKIFFSFIYFFTGLFASQIIVHSAGLKETLVKDFWVKSGKIAIIPHGVPDEASYQLSAVSHQLQKKLENREFILYFGYFHRRKGLEILIQAFQKLSLKFPDVFLVLAGGTIMQKYAQEIKRLIKDLSLEEKVLITGFLKLPDLRFLLDRCQFAVLPALYSIAASGPLAQVFAHEKAVIVSDLGVYREEIRDGENGLLVRVGDVDDLAQKIKLLMENEALKLRIIDAVKALASERRWSLIAGQTLTVYQSLNKAKSS